MSGLLDHISNSPLPFELLYSRTVYFPPTHLYVASFELLTLLRGNSTVRHFISFYMKRIDITDQNLVLVIYIECCFQECNRCVLFSLWYHIRTRND